MSQKQLNPGLLSSMRGGEIFAFQFRINGSSNPDGLVQFGANAVASVVRNSTGNFTVQLNNAFPRQLLVIPAPLAQATANTTIEGVRYVVDSYDKADGQFEVETITDDGDGTLTVEDPTDNTVVTIICISQTKDTLVEDDAS